MSKMKKENVKTPALQLESLGLQDVPNLLEIVDKKINEIKKWFPKETSTKNATLLGFGKIKDLSTVELLIKASSMILGKKKAYEEAAKEVLPEYIKVPTFKLDGYTANEWLTDIKARIIEVYHKQELKKLQEVKKTLEENLSAEIKLARDLKKIAEILVDDDKDKTE
jgi:hypothetical protein